jgi:hypothetical protein
MIGVMKGLVLQSVVYLEDTPIQSVKTEVSHPKLRTLRLKHA